MVKDGEYEKAREALRKFLKEYPGSEYADNAQYWLAETYYVMGEYENALEEFQSVTAEYPQSDKVPGAKLKQGYSYYELQDYRQARKELIEVMDEYPDHRVASMAKQQLEQIRKEQF
jgi:tol-pal system protein YbgF